ncbi:MAG: CvpA family protein [Gammaproteobacteria bacterium]|nr:CvpA family protein [Gammaproteobacteria bacterium]
MLFSHLNWVDYLILFAILVSVIVCYRRGFVGSTLTLLCWVLALGGSFKLAHPVGNMFESSVKSEQIRNILGFFIIFIGLALVGVLIIYLFNHLLEKGALHKTDKVVGGFSGIIVGVFVIAGILLTARYSKLPERPFWTQSFLIPYFHPFEDVIDDCLPTAIQAERDLMPEDIDKTLEKNISDVTDKVEDTTEQAKEKVEDVQDKGKKASDAVKDLTDEIKE